MGLHLTSLEMPLPHTPPQKIPGIPSLWEKREVEGTGKNDNIVKVGEESSSYEREGRMHKKGQGTG